MSTEQEREELLDLIAGRGKWAWTGKAGFHTYPGRDENQRNIHEACLELERAGKIHRLTDEPDHVCWVEVVATAMNS